MATVTELWFEAISNDPDYTTMQVFNGDGNPNRVFSINFEGGYIYKSHVLAFYVNTSSGERTDLTITWLTDATFKLSAAVPVGSDCIIYRSTPTNAPLASFSKGAIINEINLDRVVKQAIFATAEMTDRFNKVQADSDAALSISYAAAQSADAATAVSNTAAAAAVQATTDSTAALTAASASVVTANHAESVANAIDGKAQTALDNSVIAVSNAATALSTANAIDGKATTALSNSAAAIGTANAAATTANDIAGTANTALSNANTAVTTANTAVSTANAASSSVSALDSAVVKLTGAQTIAGVKTLQSSPVLPVATADNNPTTMSQFIQKQAYNTGSTNSVTASFSFMATSKGVITVHADAYAADISTSASMEITSSAGTLSQAYLVAIGVGVQGLLRRTATVVVPSAGSYTITLTVTTATATGKTCTMTGIFTPTS